VDDYPLDRELVRVSLDREPGRFALTEAASRDEFLGVLDERLHDLVLSDFHILGFEGLDVIDTVRSPRNRGRDRAQSIRPGTGAPQTATSGGSSVRE